MTKNETKEEALKRGKEFDDLADSLNKPVGDTFLLVPFLTKDEECLQTDTFQRNL
jgi:hypothetical protein